MIKKTINNRAMTREEIDEILRGLWFAVGRVRGDIAALEAIDSALDVAIDYRNEVYGEEIEE